jgi:hypothetical protein
MLKVRQMAAAAAAGIVVWMLAAGGTAAERDLYAGVAYLRAGAQSQAEDSLTRYLGGEGDPEVRRSVSRVLPLLKQPLPGDVREYLAATIEEKAGLRSKGRGDSLTPGYWSRIFPVFP